MKNSYWIKIFLLLFVLIAHNYVVNAQNFTVGQIGAETAQTRQFVTESAEVLPFRLSDKLSDNNVAAEDEFGWSVEIDGDTAIISDLGEDVGGNQKQGAAYIFVKIDGSWQMQQMLTAPDGRAEDHFGFSVDIDGNTAVVSSMYSEFNGGGKVYVYTRSGTNWTLQTILSGSPEIFGASPLSIDGDTLLIGARNPVVFVRNGSSWMLQATLSAFDLDDYDGYGLSVKVKGDTALIGAPNQDIIFPNDNQGSVYVFTRSGTSWSQTRKITVANSKSFGFDIDFDGTTAIFGSLQFSQGKAYVFKKDAANWNLEATLQATDSPAPSAFGFKVSLSGNNAVVTAYRSSFNSQITESGTAYVFSRSGTIWSQAAKLSASDRAKNDNFGRDAAIFGNTVIVGANKSNFLDNDAPGAAYVFSDVSNTAPDLQAASDRGISQSDDITNIQQIAFDANNVTIGSTVQLLRNNTVVDSKIATTSTISLTDNVPNEGQYRYTTREINGGIPSLTSEVLFVTVDLSAPTVTIDELAQNDPTRNSTIGYIIYFSEPISGFLPEYVSLAESTANVSQTTRQLNPGTEAYTISIFNIISNGQYIRATIPGGQFTDVAGNYNLPSTSTDNTVTIDNVNPTVTVNQSSGQADPTRNLPLVYDIVFSEPITDLTQYDIKLTGSTANTIGAVVNLSGSGTQYTATVSNINSNGGYVQASLDGFAAADWLGNGSLPSTSTDNKITFDNVSPTVTINQAPGQFDPAITQPINYRVVFSENVTDFSSADVSLAGSTANVSGAVISVSGSGNVYNVSVGNILSSGFVKASINAGSAYDLLGNPNAASTSTDNTVSINIRKSVFDFDGDGKSDLSVFRPSNGAWYLQQSTNGFTGTVFGLGSDLITPADYDGDGKTDIAVFRNGSWYYLKSSTNAFVGVNFGQNGDLPRPADFDGDGKADINVFRPSNGAWYRLNSSDGTFYGIAFGQNGDQPLIADFDGDGKSDITVFRPNTGTFYSLDSSNGNFRGVAFGFGTDIPTMGDFDGDGKTDVAVFRPSNGNWYRLNSSSGEFYGVAFGQNGDIPAVGDYDGDGKADISVFRNGNWYRLNSSSGTYYGEQFGVGTDKPVPAAFQ